MDHCAIRTSIGRHATAEEPFWQRILQIGRSRTMRFDRTAGRELSADQGRKCSATMSTTTAPLGSSDTWQQGPLSITTKWRTTTRSIWIQTRQTVFFRNQILSEQQCDRQKQQRSQQLLCARHLSDAANALIDRSYVWSNGWSGIVIEVSPTAIVRNNMIGGNGLGYGYRTPGITGAGIYFRRVQIFRCITTTFGTTRTESSVLSKSRRWQSRHVPCRC